MTIVALTFRILVASIVLLFGLEKLLNPSLSRGTLSHYLPRRTVVIAATVLPTVEVIVGLLFLFGLPFSGIALLALLLVFTAALMKRWMAASGKSDCGCSKSPLPIRVAVLRNALMMLAGLVAVLLPTGRASPLLALLEAGFGALVVGGGLLLARKRPWMKPVSAVQTQVGENARVMGRRGALAWVLNKGALALGAGALLPFVLNTGHALAYFGACQYCRDYYEYICNCGILDVYKVDQYNIYWCGTFCYSIAYLIRVQEGC